jgi:uncharacterized Ntn-hydrolase superfamily protein
MTYSIAAKCPRTGMFGAAVTTSSIAVGARCVYARADCGVVLTQHRTDPRLGPKGLELLAQGLEAKEVIRRLTEGAPGIGWRQLAVVDREGRTAVFHGDRISSVHSADEGPGHVAIGNIIRTKAVTRAMANAFGADPQLHLAERLVRSMEAGYAAGGEPKQVKSAALLVVDRGRPRKFPARRPARGFRSAATGAAALAVGNLRALAEAIRGSGNEPGFRAWAGLNE